MRLVWGRSSRTTRVSRILHMLPHVRNRGNGLVNVAVDIAYLQAKAGYAVTMAAESGEYRGLLESAGVTFVEFPHPTNLVTLLKSPLRFRQLVAAVRPDVVHAHVLTGTLLAALLRFGSNYTLVASLHSEFRRLAVLMGLADRIISVSDASAIQLERRGISKAKIHVIKNAPLDSPRTALCATLADLEMARPAITTIAGLSFRKGIDVLLDAFEIVHRRVPLASLYIIGAGPDHDAFELQAERLEARSNIHFLGFQPNPKPYLSSTDIFVLASRREPFGLAIVEARAAGCAIIASDVDGIPEAVGGSRSGLLVPPGDPDKLAAALISLLTDEAALKHWRDAALEGLEAFAVERLHRETLAVYERA